MTYNPGERKILIGIDEAGRGAVIGPLVVSGVLIDEKNQHFLSEIGVKDSKLLSPKRREIIRKEIMKLPISYESVIIEPETIDNNYNQGISLNQTELDAFISISQNLLKELGEGKQVHLIVDSVDVNTERFEKNLREILGESIIIIAEHQADKNYLIVGAASIIAKTTRDKKIQELNIEFGPFGSGYPSDQKTQDFLREIYRRKREFPNFVRKTWDTCNKIIQEENNLKLDEFKS
ncbi:MAG: ribonuclease HII [Candidatus Ranarchaeia archaeon]